MIRLILKFLFQLISLGFNLRLINSQSSNINNIVFDLADLTVDHKTSYGVIHLEAFKSSLNDVIIEQKASEKYGQLNWLSIGHPTLLFTKNNSTIFSMKTSGFDINIELLTDYYRDLFRYLVKRKYKIDIDPEQIVNLIPAKFECQLSFYSQNGDKVLINGKATQLSKFPLTVSFDAPITTKERVAFEEILATANSAENFDIVCEINSQGRAYRQNTFIITGQQINQMGVDDEIFGDGQEIYVTRNQISVLSSKLYQRLNIIEEYQIPETQFSQNFINDFISQTANSINQYVSFDQAFSKLSTYDFSEDLKPSVVKSEYSRLFTIKKVGTKEILTVNTTQYQKLGSSSSNSVGGGASASFAGIGFGSSANFANSKSDLWVKQSTLFANQLRELNNYDQNEIEWARSGNIIIPKSIKVSKLSKASFSKNLVFSRIKKEYYDAPFKRIYTLNFPMNGTNINNDSPFFNFPNGMIIAIGTKDIEKSFASDGHGFGKFIGWYICDGRNGAPDLRGKVLVGRDNLNQLSDYNETGKIGGRTTVKLTINELPRHTHLDKGHTHNISADTSIDGEHRHWYNDIFHSERIGGWVTVPGSTGSGDTDNDNKGFEMARITDSSGSHKHSIKAMSTNEKANLEETGNGGEFDIRQPYFTVFYAIFLG